MRARAEDNHVPKVPRASLFSLQRILLLWMRVLQGDYAIALFFLGMAATAVGQVVVNHLVKKVTSLLTTHEFIRRGYWGGERTRRVIQCGDAYDRDYPLLRATRRRFLIHDFARTVVR